MSGVPTVRSPDASELTGRGLRLVRELSDDWGVTAADADGGTGKSVWFTLRLAATGRRLQDAD